MSPLQMRQIFNRAGLTTTILVAGGLGVGAVVATSVYFTFSRSQLPHFQATTTEPTRIATAPAPSSKDAQPAPNTSLDSDADSDANETALSEAQASNESLRQQIAHLEQTLSSQQTTIQSLRNAADSDSALARSNIKLPAIDLDEQDDEIDDESMGRRDPTTIYSRAEIDTAIAEAESILGTAIAQGGFTTFDVQRYRQLNKYLPTEMARAFEQRILTALADGSIIKYD